MVSIESDQSPSTNISHRIALIGSGPVGIALATQFVLAGHSVSISNSRGPESLKQAESLTGATASDVDRAVTVADVVVLAVPSSKIVSLQPILRASLRQGTVLIDTCNYYPSRDGNIESLDHGMPDSVWVSETLSFPVIKAFNGIIASNIVTNANPKGSPKRSALPVAGDNDRAITVVMKLVEEAGFDAFNAGPLADSWRQQPGQPSYCTEPSLKELPSLLGSADYKKAIAKRDKGKSIVDRLPPDFSPQILVRVSRFDAGLDRWKLQSWSAILVLVFALLKNTSRQK